MLYLKKWLVNFSSKSIFFSQILILSAFCWANPAAAADLPTLIGTTSSSVTDSKSGVALGDERHSVTRAIEFLGSMSWNGGSGAHDEANIITGFGSGSTFPGYIVVSNNLNSDADNPTSSDELSKGVYVYFHSGHMSDIKLDGVSTTSPVFIPAATITGSGATLSFTFNRGSVTEHGQFMLTASGFTVNGFTVTSYTPTTTSDTPAVTARQTIRNLTSKHAVNLTSHGLGLSGLMTGVGFGGQGINNLTGNLLPVTLNYSNNSGQASGSFAFSLQEYAKWEQRKAFEGESAKPADERVSSAVESPVNVWTKGRWTEANDDRGGIDQNSDFGVVYVGADYRYQSDMYIGVLAQVDWFEETSNGLSTQGEGDGWMVGPYIVSRLEDDLILDARIAWGQSDNKVNMGTAWDSYDTERWQVEANLTGVLDYDDWQINPSLGLVYFEEEQKEYVDSTSTTIAAQTNSLGSLSFGPTAYYTIKQGDGTVIKPMFGLKGVWDFDAPDITDVNGNAVGTDGLRGQAKIGLNATLEDGSTMQGSYVYDGIGVSAFESHTLEFVFNKPIQISGLPKGSNLRGTYSMIGDDLVESLTDLSDSNGQTLALEISIPF